MIERGKGTLHRHRVDIYIYKILEPRVADTQKHKKQKFRARETALTGG